VPPREPVVTTYLELTDPAGIRPPSHPAPQNLAVERSDDAGATSAWFYEQVGRQWSWLDRAPWTPEQWASWAERVETWVATLDDELAGYVELHPHDNDVEIAYFGLLTPFHGRGIGAHLLTFALNRGFVLGSRVWVHTCTLDGPHALANYESRGMQAFRRETNLL
jgi:GNAT superfamily N-acetyltransferase